MFNLNTGLLAYLFPDGIKTIILFGSLFAVLLTAYFLGSNLIQEDQGGGTYTYTGDSGVARFRSNGSFEVAGTLATEDVESFCRSFCKSFS